VPCIKEIAKLPMRKYNLFLACLYFGWRMPENSHRKRHKAGFCFSSKKHLEKSKMLRHMQKTNGAKMNSIVWTLSYEDDGVEAGHFQYGDSLTKIIERIDRCSKT